MTGPALPSRMDPPSGTDPAAVYAQLKAPFDRTWTDPVSGMAYITGEQCITRLNQTLGWDGWAFEVVAHGIHEAADEVWVMGRITAYADDGRTVMREQFGGHKLQRRRDSGALLDLGSDLKGAATDALKKCAMALGVGLYLSEKTDGDRRGPTVAGRDAFPPAAPPQRAPGGDDGALTCADCGAALTPTSFRDGTTWEPAQLATFGRRKHNRVLCMTHYRAANEAARNAPVMTTSPAFDDAF